MAGGQGYFLFFLVAFLTLTALLIWPVFPYIVVAILLANLWHPLDRRMARYLRSSSARAALLTLLAFLSFAFPLVLVFLGISRDLASAMQIERAQRFIESARVWLAGRRLEFVATWMVDAIAEGRDFLGRSIPALFGSLFNVVLGIFVCLFVFYYFIKEGEGIWDNFLQALPLPNKLKSQLAVEVTGILRGIFYGQMLTALLQGALGGIGLMIFQVPQAGVLTAVMTLCAFFPFVGTVLVWGPAALLKLAAGDNLNGLGLLAFGAGIIMNVDNFVRPRLISQHSKVHPVVILIGIIGGTKVFGFIGFLVGPLIFAVFLQLFRFIAEYRKLESAPTNLSPPGLTPPPIT